MTVRRSLTSEKLRADTMRDVSEYPQTDYWAGYRLGLTARSSYHEALLAAIGCHDAGRDARGRGYRDGLAFAEGRE